ncbi:hypothetical protein B0T45_09225 [Chromobacterium haemolyticum]|uniref:DUF3987 domain-containing protein n=1 Tax=Chromobacterium haemolyticum TaxID=394935 RepID=A0A1W0D1W5_9NEIS|nr:hypothetical protein B0T45_09225 [Chromobacterium haemolyticum]
MAIGAALAAMSAVLNGRYELDGNGLRPNLYTILVGSTGCGKSQAQDLVSLVASHYKYPCKTDVGSAEGIEDTVLKGPDPKAALILDEIGHLFKAMENGKDSNALKMQRKLLQMFSSSQTGASPRAKSGESTVEFFKNPYMTLIGTTTESRMEGLSEEMISSGLLTRCLIVKARNTYQENPFDKVGISKQKEINNYLSFLNKPFDISWNSGKSNTLVKIAPDAAKLWEDSDKYMRAVMRDSEELNRAICSRTIEKALRIAMTIAIWESNEPIITRSILQWALNFVQISDGHLIKVKNEMASSELMADANKLLNRLREYHNSKPEKFQLVECDDPNGVGTIQVYAVKRKEIGDNLSWDMKRTDEACNQLSESEHIHYFKKKGVGKASWYIRLLSN